jgi:hypothetical protein
MVPCLQYGTSDGFVECQKFPYVKYETPDEFVKCQMVPCIQYGTADWFLDCQMVSYVQYETLDGFLNSGMISCIQYKNSASFVDLLEDSKSPYLTLNRFRWYWEVIYTSHHSICPDISNQKFSCVFYGTTNHSLLCSSCVLMKNISVYMSIMKVTNFVIH